MLIRKDIKYGGCSRGIILNVFLICLERKGASTIFLFVYCLLSILKLCFSKFYINKLMALISQGATGVVFLRGFSKEEGKFLLFLRPFLVV